MAISERIITEYTDATLIRLHKRNFHEAFALAILDNEIPVGVDVDELKSAVGKELNRMKQSKDPVQLAHANDHGAVFIINKETEVSFKHENSRAKFFGVRWVGEGKKPEVVEVDARLLSRAYHRASNHFREVRRANGTLTRARKQTPRIHQHKNQAEA